MEDGKLNNIHLFIQSKCVQISNKCFQLLCLDFETLYVMAVVEMAAILLTTYHCTDKERDRAVNFPPVLVSSELFRSLAEGNNCK